MNINLSTQLQTSLEFNQLSQTEQIINYLTNPVGERIDTWTAINQFHCTCLAQRIFDIRTRLEYRHIRDEYIIHSETTKRNGKHFTEYWFERINNG